MKQNFPIDVTPYLFEPQDEVSGKVIDASNVENATIQYNGKTVTGKLRGGTITNGEMVHVVETNGLIWGIKKIPVTTPKPGNYYKSWTKKSLADFFKKKPASSAIRMIMDMNQRTKKYRQINVSSVGTNTATGKLDDGRELSLPVYTGNDLSNVLTGKNLAFFDKKRDHVIGSIRVFTKSGYVRYYKEYSAYTWTGRARIEPYDPYFYGASGPMPDLPEFTHIWSNITWNEATKADYPFLSFSVETSNIYDNNSFSTVYRGPHLSIPASPYRQGSDGYYYEILSEIQFDPSTVSGTQTDNGELFFIAPYVIKTANVYCNLGGAYFTRGEYPWSCACKAAMPRRGERKIR